MGEEAFSMGYCLDLERKNEKQSNIVQKRVKKLLEKNKKRDYNEYNDRIYFKKEVYIWKSKRK